MLRDCPTMRLKVSAPPEAARDFPGIGATDTTKRTYFFQATKFAQPPTIPRFQDCAARYPHTFPQADKSASVSQWDWEAIHAAGSPRWWQRSIRQRTGEVRRVVRTSSFFVFRDSGINAQRPCSVRVSGGGMRGDDCVQRLAVLNPFARARLTHQSCTDLHHRCSGPFRAP